jgi:hypothetical protein
VSDAERGGDGRRSERHRERERRRRLTATCCGGLPRPSPHRSRRCRRRRRRRLPRLRGTAACCRCRCRRCCSRRRARAARARASAGTAPWPPASPPANATQEAFRWGSVGFQTGFQRGSLEFNRWRTKKKNGAEDSWWEVPVATPRAGCTLAQPRGEVADMCQRSHSTTCSAHYSPPSLAHRLLLAAALLAPLVGARHVVQHGIERRVRQERRRPAGRGACHERLSFQSNWVWD